MSEELKHRPTNNEEWDRLKLEYLASDMVNVSKFFRNIKGFGDTRSYDREKMKGWKKEKIERLKKGRLQAEEQIIEKKIENYLVSADTLGQAKIDIIDILTGRLNGFKGLINKVFDAESGKEVLIIDKEIPTKELIEIWKVIKVELGEPTNIHESQLGDEEKELAREIQNIIIQ